MTVTVTNRQRRWPTSAKELKRVAQRILSALACPDNELAVTIVGDRSIRRLNREYLERDKATNVISFSMQDGDFGAINPGLLGDVVISADTAAREADEGVRATGRGLSFCFSTVSCISPATITSGAVRRKPGGWRQKSRRSSPC